MIRSAPTAPAPSLAVIATLCLLSLAARADATPPPLLDHVVVVIMENKNYDQVRTQPYTASLIAAGSTFTNSYAITHPSQPNYIALWAGSTLGVTNDVCPPPGSPYSAENLGHACEAAGVTWKAYSEDLPAAGSAVCTANGSLYTRKHDPWTDFSNLNHMNERPYTDLAPDRAAGAMPRLAFIIPNNCHNSHDTGCTVALADAWLAANLPAMIDSLGPNGMLVLTWDEDNGAAGNHILTVFVGPKVLGGYVSTTHITHYTLLRTLCETLGLTPFGAAAGEASITDVWGPDVTPPTVTLTSPNGGEYLVGGAIANVLWSAADNVAVTGVDILLSTNGGGTYPTTIAANEPNDGVFPWTVGTGLASQTCRLKAVAHDAANFTNEDPSDANFTIGPPPSAPPTITLLGPNGGESLDGMTVQPITWSASDDIGVVGVDIFLSLDGGATFPIVVATNETNDGSYTWSVEDAATPAARIRVRARDNNFQAAEDASDADFAITLAATGVGGAGAVPARLSLGNAPDPFTGNTTIRFAIPSATSGGLAVFNVEGKMVRRLAEGALPAGQLERVWDGKDESGNRLPAGLYFLKLSTGHGSVTHRVTLVR